MAQIYQAGSVNTNALTVPDVDIIEITPQLLVTGAPSDIMGIVGVGSWGLVDQAMTAGTLADSVGLVGPVTNRSNDLSTAVAISVLQDVSDMRLVRVTDGTDTAASFQILSADLTASATFWSAFAAAVNTGAGVLRGASQAASIDGVHGVLTALYTGILGNTITVSVGQGAKTGTYRGVVSLSGAQPEVYDNLSAATAPIFKSYALAGGTDGASGVTSAELVGQDLSPGTGAYALRGQGCATLVVADLSDATQWTTLDALALSESSYVVHQVPFGTSIAAAITLKQSEGLDSRYSKVMHGDGLFWNDTTNGIVRLTSPSTFAAAKIASLSPEQSPLNKPLSGLVGSQKSGLASTAAAARYSTADLSQLFQGGIDVVCNPAPGGAYWACRSGRNSSSNAAIRQDASTTMNNTIATSLAAVMGFYVGIPIDAQLLQEASAALNSLLGNMLNQGLLGTVSGIVPYKVVCDQSNNPLGETSLGYLVASVRVQTKAINENFLVDLEDGPSVVIASNLASAS